MTLYKSTAKAPANIKNQTTGVLVYELQFGEYVIGELSTAKTDLINFTKCYRADGTVKELGVVCKVSLTNMTTPVVFVPPIEPPIDPNPPTYQLTELEVVEIVTDSNGVVTKLPMRIFVPKV